MKFDDAPILDAKPRGGVFGGQAGYNWQYGSVVGGLEVDFDGADINQSSDVGTIQRVPVTREAKINELASARARLGYAVYPGLLAYGTAGLGWGHSELTLSHPFVGAVSADSNEFGWTAGAGLEYKLIEHILLRAEYLHYDFAKDDMGAKTTVDVIRGGLSYKF
jgi:outer membrane immunogenic protein